MSQRIEIKATANTRLDDLLRRYFEDNIVELAEKFNIDNPEVSNSKIRRFIISGAVFVDRKQNRRPAFELRSNSTVSFDFDKDKFFFEKQPDDIKFELTQKDVLFEDDSLIMVDKPAFFPVEQTITGNRDNLHDAIVKYLWSKNPSLRNPPYVGILHRLDRETSGVILFTKTRSVNKDVHDLFENHKFEKEYFALVQADKKIKDSFTVENYIGRISKKTQAGKWGAVTERNGGQYAKTDFSIVLKLSFGKINCYLLKCTLFTGRTHQIRVHLSGLGLPILGDELYGGIKCERMMLHACRLSFVHPITKETINVESPPPFIEKL